MQTVRVRYESGVETDLDVPEVGTVGRYLFDQAVAAGRYEVIDAPEAPAETAPVVVEVEPEDRPAVNAPKADWVAYAAAQGAEDDWLAEATKAELVEKYGA